MPCCGSEQSSVCCCNCSVDFPFLHECHNISHVRYYDSSSFHAVCVCHWKYYDNNCSRWQLISLPVNGLGCCRLRLAFTFQTLLPYVSDTFYNGYLSSHKQLDGGSWNFFHTNIGVNEVTTERIIERHLTMKLNWCFRRWARLKALTSVHQLHNNASPLIATCLLHTDQHHPTHTLTHTDTHT